MKVVKEHGYLVEQSDGTLRGRVTRYAADQPWYLYKTKGGALRSILPGNPNDKVVYVTLTIEEKQP